MDNNKQQNEIPTQRNLIIFAALTSLLIIPAVVYFGWYVLAIVAVALAASIVVEYLFAKFRKRAMDYSWVVTPLIFAMFLPPTLELWIVAVGASFGTFFAKSLFGGFGKTIFNPAVVGIMFIMISFPEQVQLSWFNPQDGEMIRIIPVVELYSQGDVTSFSWNHLIFGGAPGTIGGTFRFGVMLIGLVLIGLKLIDWRIPVFYLGTMVLVTLIGRAIVPDVAVDPFKTIFVGSVMFAAFFAATDPVTMPIKPSGRIIYAIGLALFTLLIRYFAAFQEGVIFAIVLMNALAPIIDMYIYDKKEEESEQTVEVTA